MRGRKGTKGAEEAEEPGSTPGLGMARTRRDELAYLTDLLKDLGAIADRLGCPTLAGILTLAKREAQLERDRS